MNICKKEIEFEELPKRLQHALEILLEWHRVIVYEIEKDTYGFYILNKELPYDSSESSKKYPKNISNNPFGCDSVSDLLNIKFKDMRCKYFYKGELHSRSMKIEIIDLCYFKQGYGFSIELHSNNYGFLYGEESKIIPAYVHVLAEDESIIGLLNITGSCPKKVSDIKEIRQFDKMSNSTKKATPLMKHRKNIIKWANQPGELYNKWEWTQQIWATAHGIRYKG
jgi:hypothetical protein